MLRKNSKIFIAGHNGLVGSSILQLLKKNKYNKILLRNRNQLDLTDFKKVDFVTFSEAVEQSLLQYPCDWLALGVNFPSSNVFGCEINTIFT